MTGFEVSQSNLAAVPATRGLTAEEAQALTTLLRIDLVGIEAWGYHGVFAHERENGQPFIADLRLWFRCYEAPMSDDLGETVNYADVVDLVRSMIETDPLNLVEALAERIAAGVLRMDPDRLLAVRVGVHKPQAPLEKPVADIRATVTRAVAT